MKKYFTFIANLLAVFAVFIFALYTYWWILKYHWLRNQIIHRQCCDDTERTWKTKKTSEMNWAKNVGWPEWMVWMVLDVEWMDWPEWMVWMVMDGMMYWWYEWNCIDWTTLNGIERIVKKSKVYSITRHRWIWQRVKQTFCCFEINKRILKVIRCSVSTQRDCLSQIYTWIWLRFQKQYLVNLLWSTILGFNTKKQESTEHQEKLKACC